jgi:Ca-activated chloride channel family protein
MKTLTLALLLICLVPTGNSFAQFPFPVQPERTFRNYWTIERREIRTVVRDHVATTEITETIRSNASHEVMVRYMLPIAPGVVIDQMSFVVDGVEMKGEIYEVNEARRIFEDIVRRRLDPALLEYAGCGLLRTSAFPLQPGKPATISIHYTDVPYMDADLYELWYPLTSAQYCSGSIENLDVSIDIETESDLAVVYSPTTELKLDYRAPNHVIVTYSAHRTRPNTDLQLFYGETEEDVGAKLLTFLPAREREGYYLLMVSPNPRLDAGDVLPKDIMIVLDQSGSMSGEKIQQARDATQFILHNLNLEDRFNLMTYNDRVDLCFRSIVPATGENVDVALDFLARVRAGSGTNIHDALERAMRQCADATRTASLEDIASRPSIVIFLTDGLPTVGVTKESTILRDTQEANEVQARLFPFGVGYNVNVRLLDRLAADNGGVSTYVNPAESIETKVSSLYNKIRNPVMTNVVAEIAGIRTRDALPERMGNLFAGEQLLQVGRFSRSSSIIKPQDKMVTELTISGNLRGEFCTLTYPVTIDLSGRTEVYRFVEKLWAARRIGYLLDEVQLHGRVDELVDEVIYLSKKYGIITQYTSFLADENVDLTNRAEIHARAGRRLKALSTRTTGAGAQMDASARSNLQYMIAPFSHSLSGTPEQIGTDDVQVFEANQSTKLETMRVIGTTPLYRRDSLWIAADATELDLERDAEQIERVERFSDKYFAIVKANSREENRVLAVQKEGERLLVVLRGQAYLIL